MRAPDGAIHTRRVTLPIRYARSGELFIAHTADGSGPPNLVVTTGHFLHLEVAREWPPYDRFMNRLASISRLVLLDRRGTGLSDGMDRTTTIDDAMDDIRAVMDHNGIEQAVLVGGAEGKVYGKLGFWIKARRMAGHDICQGLVWFRDKRGCPTLFP